MQIKHTVSIDFTLENREKIRVKQFDTNTRILEFVLTNEDKKVDLTNVSPFVYFKKPDKKIVFVKVAQEDIDFDKSTFKIVATNNILAVAGNMQVEITLVTLNEEGLVDSIIASKIVNFFVEKTIRNDEAIESTNEFMGIQDILDKINSIEDIEEKLAKLDKIDEMLEQLEQLDLHSHTNLEVIEQINQENIDLLNSINPNIQITVDEMIEAMKTGLVLEMNENELDEVINFVKKQPKGDY